MKIRAFQVPPGAEDTKRDLTLVEQRLLLNQGGFDHDIASVLAYLSSWAYAEPDDFAAALARVALPGSQCAAIGVDNDVLLLSNRAYLVQSADRQSLILCFRGTPPRDSIAWASNAAVELTPFYVGDVHSGFYGSIIAMWPSIAKLLHRALDGEALSSAVEQVNKQDSAEETGAGARGLTGAHGETAELRERTARGKPISLYITGHSLGGALGVLAAALLHVGEATLVQQGKLIELSPYQKLLRGVYTFGQPKVGDSFFIQAQDRNFGTRLFRMIYEHDFVTTLPTVVMGPYEHFGVEYHASEGGWALSPETTNVWSGLLSIAQTALFTELSLFAKVFPPIRWFSLLQGLSFDEHLPIRYMRTSVKKSAYAELQLDYRAMSPNRG